jgi:signal transduction histidine kinase
MLWLVGAHPAWRARRALMGAYFLGLLALLAALILHSPWYGFFAFAGYLHAFQLLRGRWRVAGIAATAGLIALAQLGGRLPEASLAGVGGLLVLTLVNLAVAGISWAAYAQTELRKHTIDELAEANRRLVATMAENDRLQAELVASARQAGAMDERQRLAREIHDTIAQGLIGIVTQLQAAEQTAGRPDEAHRHLDAAARLARESLAEARRSVMALSPAPLERARLPEALAEVSRRWSGDSGVPVELVTTGTARPVHPDVEAALLRAAQEALANVARHAAASRVGLTLSYMEDVVTLDVRDDGVGFDPGQGPDGDGPGGFGLRAMRERLRLLAGTLEVESEPGTGTAISATVPALATEPAP